MPVGLLTLELHIPDAQSLKDKRQVLRSLSRSLRLRNTCLLSFSDCASGMCSSRVSKPTGICGSGKNSAVYFLPEVALACPAASAALILVTLKHSKTSPTLTSLKLATPAPHSKPVRTSLTSSLNRFKEFSFDV